MCNEQAHSAAEDVVRARVEQVDETTVSGSAPALATPAEYFVAGLVILAIGVAVLIALGSVI